MRRVDLNLLYVLRELLREPNTTTVADKLGLTQSAVSAALGRLRWALEDDLFVRAGRGLVPTRRAESLKDPVEDIIGRIEALVEQVHFEPETLQRTFVITAADFTQVAITPPLAAELSARAPRSTILFSSIMQDTPSRARSGHIDIIIAPAEALGGDSELLESEPLYEDVLVAAIWEGNNEIGENITESQYHDAGHLAYTPSTGVAWTSTTTRFMNDYGLKVNTIARYSGMIPLMHGLVGSQLVATVPRKLVETCGRALGIRAVRLPFDVEPFTVRMHWNKSVTREPEHQWFRELVRQAVADGIGECTAEHVD